MPFKSDKQKKWMHANEPEMAKKWEKKSKAEGTTTPFPSALIDKAIKVAKSMGGNMTGAVKKIEKIKKGLSKNGRVEYALQQANESDIEEGFGGELKGKDKEKFEKARKENAEQLGYKVTGVSDIKESVNESTKKVYNDLYVNMEKAYEKFAREVVHLAQASVKLVGGQTDKKIILKHFHKNVLGFMKLMISWNRGHQSNPHIDESDLGYTTKKQKIVRAVHKTSGKEIIVVDTPSSRKTLKKIGFVVKESVNEAVKVRNGEAPMEGMWAVCDISTGKAIKEVGNARAATKLMNRLMNSGQYKEVAAKWVGESVNEAKYKGYDWKRQNRKDGHPLIVPALQKTFANMKDLKKYIDKHGTMESVNEAKSKTMTTIGSIIGKKQAQKIGGVLVDMQTALVIMKVWNALNKSNRSKFEKLPIKKMATVAWKLMK
jgi:hypothetical protein